MAEKIEVDIVTPEGRKLRDRVHMVAVRHSAGGIGVLARHEPAVIRLHIGELRVHRENGGPIDRYAIGQGFLRVSGDRAQVVVEQAEHVDDIDVARAEEAMRSCGEVVDRGEPPEADDEGSVQARREYERALARYRRAENRLRIARGE